MFKKMVILSQILFVLLSTYLVCYKNNEVSIENKNFDKVLIYNSKGNSRGIKTESELLGYYEDENVTDTNHIAIVEFDIAKPIFEDFDAYSDHDLFYKSMNDNKLNEYQNELSRYRDMVSKYYVEQNMKIVQNLDLENYTEEISYFSPHVFLSFYNSEERVEELNTVMNLYKSESVIQIAISAEIYGKTKTDAVVNKEKYGSFTLDAAFELIETKNSITTGKGIRVGVMDEGKPSRNIQGKSLTYFESMPNREHTDFITSITGGTVGIAQDVSFYYTPMAGVESTYAKYLNWLLQTQKVNVINMSYFIPTDEIYEFFSSYTDYVTDMAKVIIVKSAGNSGPDYSFITTPGLAMNIMTIGSISSNQNISSFSSYRYKESLRITLKKPELVAPGDQIIVPNVDQKSGTSFSAPMVTGIIALLLEEFPHLMLKPDTIISALINGAKKLPTANKYSPYDNESGFGLVNYKNTRNILFNNNYAHVTTSDYQKEGDSQTYGNVVIPANGEISVAMRFVINQPFAETGSTYTPFYTKHKIELIDSSNQVTVAYDDFTGNTFKFTYKNPYSTSRSYRFKVTLKSQKIGKYPEQGSITYFGEGIHTHQYIKYPSIHMTTKKHTGFCSCGLSVTSSHVVDASHVNINGGRFVPCYYCGYAIDTNTGFFPAQP